MVGREEWVTKGHGGETSVGYRYVYSFYYDGFIDIWTCQNLPNYTF